MNQPTQSSSQSSPQSSPIKSHSLLQMLLLPALVCWSLSGIAQTHSDLLIIIDDDGIGYTAQQTLFADDDLIVISLPTGRQTLQTVFSGSGSALYKRAYENDSDKLTIVSGSVFTRFRHRFSSPTESVTVESGSSSLAVTQLSATMDHYETTTASPDSLVYRVTWVLPANLELLDYNAKHSSQTDDSGSWTLNDNTVTYEQTRGLPARITINYLVNRNSPSRKDACLATVGPSEWCSPDVDLDRVPDYRDLCIPFVNTDLQVASHDNSIILTDSTLSDNPSSSRTDSTTRLTADDSLGCPDNELIVLSDVQFESGQTYLNAKSRAALGKVAVALQRMPDRLFRIATHTDNAGYVSNNQLLSENRADAIRHYLMLRGVGPNQIQARGYGETNPAHDNRTAAGRRANRRVELHQLD